VNVPNLISLLRLAAVPVVVWLILNDRIAWALWLFVAAGVSDAIDGYLARIWRQRTLLGAYLDPIADKALLVCVFVTLGQVGKIENWLVILVVSRDIMIVGGVILLFLLNQRVKVAPSFASKANTTVQIAFAALVLARYGLPLTAEGWGVAIDYGTYAVAATTLLSGAHYVVVGIRHMAAADDAGAGRPRP
jgi:cardiolipin synthase